MTTRVFNGTKIRDQVFAELKDEIARLATEGVRPSLAAVLVGENPPRGSLSKQDCRIQPRDKRIIVSGEPKKVISGSDRYNCFAWSAHWRATELPASRDR